MGASLEEFSGREWREATLALNLFLSTLQHKTLEKDLRVASRHLIPSIEFLQKSAPFLGLATKEAPPEVLSTPRKVCSKPGRQFQRFWNEHIECFSHWDHILLGLRPAL